MPPGVCGRGLAAHAPRAHNGVMAANDAESGMLRNPALCDNADRHVASGTNSWFVSRYYANSMADFDLLSRSMVGADVRSDLPVDAAKVWAWNLQFKTMSMG